MFFKYEAIFFPKKKKEKIKKKRKRKRFKKKKKNKKRMQMLVKQAKKVYNFSKASLSGPLGTLASTFFISDLSSFIIIYDRADLKLYLHTSAILEFELHNLL